MKTIWTDHVSIVPLIFVSRSSKSLSKSWANLGYARIIEIENFVDFYCEQIFFYTGLATETQRVKKSWFVKGQKLGTEDPK